MTQETKHTPGPWMIEDKLDTLIIHDECRDICEIHSVTDNHNQTFLTDHANARLIAAAPELLEALEGILGDMPDTEEINGRFTCRHCGREWSAMMGDDEVPENCPSDDCPGYVARAAIAKARGEG